ncbi:MAG TPA: carbon-nitrogen hydrolase [Bacteroidales bacterium]|nr:carbon-nitrogen hydrolase [Bacteroidales bacterium]
MERKVVKTGLVQMACVADKQANIEKAVTLIREAAGKGAQIICLQELFASEYFCWEESYDNFSLAEPVPGPTTRRLQDLAAELDVVLLASLFEKRARGIYHNTLAVIDADGTFLGKYRKNHIPDDPGYYEKFYFTPGDTGYSVFCTKYARIGGLVCWDQWYPEAARITSLMGAEILFFPTAIGWAVSQSDAVNKQQYAAWQTIQKAHAIANGVFVVSVNRTGYEKDMNFWGGSFIVDPYGDLLFQASHEKEEVHVEEMDLGKIDKVRVHWPFLRDRRIDSYGPILNRYIDED